LEQEFCALYEAETQQINARCSKKKCAEEKARSQEERTKRRLEKTAQHKEQFVLFTKY
jgi:hypothetical protein